MKFKSIEHEQIYKRLSQIDEQTELRFSDKVWVEEAESLINTLSSETPYMHMPPVSATKSLFLIKTFVKRVSRLMTGWYVNPFVAYQNDFNAKAILVLKKHNELLENLQNELKKTAEDNNTLTQKNRQLLDRNKELEDKLQMLSQGKKQY